MKKVYKYPVRITDISTVELPKGAQILHIDAQGDGVYLWALIDVDEKETETITLCCAGTGHPIEENENR